MNSNPRFFLTTPLVYTKILDFRALWGPKRSRKKEINHHGQRVYGGIVWLDQIFHQSCIAFHRSIVKTGPTCMKRRKKIIIYRGIWLNLVLTGWFFLKLWLKVLHKNDIIYLLWQKFCDIAQFWFTYSESTKFLLMPKWKFCHEFHENGIRKSSQYSKVN